MLDFAWALIAHESEKCVRKTVEDHESHISVDLDIDVRRSPFLDGVNRAYKASN